MGKYTVKFEIEVEVDMPDINIGGEPGTAVYQEMRIDNVLSDNEFNDIVSEAINIMEDIGDNVTEITYEGETDEEEE